MVLSALALLVVLLVLGGRPAVSYGDSPPPPTVGLSGPSQAQMPDGVVLHLTMSSSPDGDVSAAIYDENWNAVRGCIGSCDIRVMTGLLEGGGHPVTKTFHAMSHAPDSQVSAIADLEVTFAPPDWQVSLDMPRGVTVLDPIATTMAVTPSIASQYAAYLIDADTGSYANMSCGTGAGSCSKNINTGWMTGLPVTRHYQAQMTLGATTFSSPIKTVVIYPPSIGVKVTVPPFVLPGHTYKVKVTNSYSQWTPYTIIVTDASGAMIGWCAVDTTCEFTRTAGAEGASQNFTATITDGPNVISQNSSGKVDFIDPATATSNDGIDISSLAGLFGSTAAVCDSLLFFPGTHVQNTSTSDQENACVLASQASGATVEDVIRAALAAMAAAGIAVDSQSLLAWLQHYIWEHGGTTVPPGPAPPPAHPTNPPSPTPVPVASAVDALATSLTARNAAIAALGAAAATEIARRCLNLTGDEGISGDPCKNLPIFMPGSNHAEATNHRIAAIASYPPWVRLTRRIGPRDLWYRSQPECTGNGGGLDCDEFPENRTYQGGSRGAQIHRPSIAVINAGDNRALGGALSTFLIGCGLADGQAFLVVPLPPALGIPTQSGICNS
ncbi:MAG: hypothetical protein ABW167_19060 [Baekduia sp.]